MKKRDKSIAKHYPPIKLYLDDLEEIEEALKKASDSISFETEEYEFDSIEELKTHYKTAQLYELEVSTRSPYVSLDLDRKSAFVYAASSEANSAGAFYRLEQIISRRLLKPRWIYSLPLVLVLTSIGTFVQYHFSNRINYYVSLSIAILLMIWGIFACYVALRRHSVIVLIHRNSEEPFFQRNKDNLTLAIISALLGAILGVAGTLIGGYFQNK